MVIFFRLITLFCLNDATMLHKNPLQTKIMVWDCCPFFFYVYIIFVLKNERPPELTAENLRLAQLEIAEREAEELEESKVCFFF